MNIALLVKTYLRKSNLPQSPDGVHLESPNGTSCNSWHHRLKRRAHPVDIPQNPSNLHWIPSCSRLNLHHHYYHHHYYYQDYYHDYYDYYYYYHYYYYYIHIYIYIHINIYIHTESQHIILDFTTCFPISPSFFFFVKKTLGGDVQTTAESWPLQRLGGGNHMGLTMDLTMKTMGDLTINHIYLY